MITPEKITEWIHEVEERPASAPLIIRLIANRLAELRDWNEELLAENIQLRSGQKAEEYESRIANLEYQLGLLKRQLGGEIAEIALPSTSTPIVETLSLLFYNAQGKVLRLELSAVEMTSSAAIARFREETGGTEMPPRLLTTGSREELLFLFDSGRTVTLPVSEIPAAEREGLDWRQAFTQEVRGREELATILPIARMSLYEFCIQTSRKGFVKKIRQAALESYLAKDFIGTGVRLPADRTGHLTFCNPNDLFVMASKEGFLWSMPVEHLPATIEAVLKLSASDHIVATFVVGRKPSLLILTQNGKAIHREAGWLEPAETFKTQGQPVFSKERREAGTRLVGAAAAEKNDWAAALSSDGKLTLYKIGDLFASGSALTAQPATTILAFTTFQQFSF